MSLCTELERPSQRTWIPHTIHRLKWFTKRCTLCALHEHTENILLHVLLFKTATIFVLLICHSTWGEAHLKRLAKCRPIQRSNSFFDIALKHQMNSALNFWLSTHSLFLFVFSTFSLLRNFFLYSYLIFDALGCYHFFFAQMLSIQFDASSPRSKSQTAMTETKTNFVCSAKNEWHTQKKATMKMRWKLSTRESYTCIQSNRVDINVYERSEFSRQKVKSEHKTLDGNNFFSLSTFIQLKLGPYNLDACNSNVYAKMKCAKGLKY